MRARSNWEVFSDQRRHARNRSIAFFFTFEEWVAWWEDRLGPDWRLRRGRRRGQYVMARHGDAGPYIAHNVKCILCSDNQREQQTNGTAGSGWNKGRRGLPKKGNKLSPEQVLEIFGSHGRYRDIALIYGVDPSLVSRIKTGNIWRYLTHKVA